MGFIGAGWIVVLGLIGLASALHPMEKPLRPVAIILIVAALGFGPISGLWGIWGVVNSVLTIRWLSTWPILWLAYLAVAFMHLAVGSLVVVRAIQALDGGLPGNPLLRRAQTGLSASSIALGVWLGAAAFIWH